MGKRVLVSGLGIAGPATAFWLERYGFEVEMVEIAPGPRTGGYVIDFWGAGFEVAERMGILPALRAGDLRIEEVRVVDGAGRKRGGFRTESVRRVMRDRFVSVPRSHLARVLYESLRGRVACRFGDTVTAIEEAGGAEGGALVSFGSGARERYDVVIGADGLHSGVRRAAFGEEERYRVDLGYAVAAFNVRDYPHKTPAVYVGYAVPDKQVARYDLADGRTGVFFIFRHSGALPEDRSGQVALVRERFSGAGWECGELLEHLEVSADAYCDTVSQIRMPGWSRGRVALVGDAAFCPSLLAGQGSAMAMVGAYVLAGELSRAAGDWGRGFAEYERKLRPYMEGKQRSGERFARRFVPRSRAGIWWRNQVMKLMGAPAVTRLAFGRLMREGVKLEAYGAMDVAGGGG
ncbi:MAG TPA: FAD-dependent monooxygenase [Phycisphaerae bacterium]|nr:FAD-dependent monooxygenase [Phycisphaerae bacterium]